jgi:DNA invertase Pin-like site-specific DNA recombinase
VSSVVWEDPVFTASLRAGEGRSWYIFKSAVSTGYFTSAHTEYTDNGVSGAKGRDQRRQLDAMLKAAARREIDVVATWSLDRLGRKLHDLLDMLNDLQQRGTDLYIHQHRIDTTSAGGRMVFQMMGAVAGFERNVIRERDMAGLERARKQGKTLGRPRINQAAERNILALKDSGLSYRKIATQAGVSLSVVQRVLREREAAVQ